MTEVEWLGSTDPMPMLDFLRRRFDRKLQLFSCACCRRVWPLLADERARGAVEVAERYADELATLEEIQSAYHAARQALQEYPEGDAPLAHYGVLAADFASCFYDIPHHARNTTLVVLSVLRAAVETGAGAEAALSAERAAHGALLRDIIGDPWRPAAVAASVLRWQAGTVLRLAEEAYERWALPAGTLDPARLTVLADALEDAGCTDPDILGHLRGAGPHVRGC